MKANELMIGDWVLYHATFDRDTYKKLTTPYNKNIRIESIAEEGVNEEYCQGDRNWIEYSELQPVPLTEEILEKNGWELSLSCEFYTHKSNRNLKLSNLLGVPSISCFGKISILHYVHEFQHVLRLCGLNELADNFKLN